MEQALTLAVADAEAWHAHRAGLEAHGGLMAPLPEAATPQLFEEVVLAVEFETRRLAEVTGRVVQVTEAGTVALLFEAEAKATLLALSLPSPAQEPEAPLWTRYDSLTKPEKIKLARYGNADARRRVLRDNDQGLHAFLLGNPGLSTQEVVGWFRAGLVPRALIEQICKRTELMGNLQIMEALVQDPRTPVPIATRLIGGISLDLCRRIAKQGRLRTQLVSAARKRVIT